MTQPPVGIDLGTTFSALSIINPAGRPEIVPNIDGERTTASAIFFAPGGGVIVGQEAVDSAAAYPDRVVRWVKRKMGDPDWRFELDGQSYSAVQLSAMILKKLKTDSERTTGPIKSVVITVPAYFDEVRRQATMEAAKLAGLEPLRIINEPTSAALAYAQSGHPAGRLLVYDLGGGTFDVSLVDVEDEKTVSVIGSDGEHELGGHDFDLALARHLLTAASEQLGAEMTPEDNPADWFNLVRNAEQLKRRLSKREEVRASVQWRGRLATVPVTRAEFEALIEKQLYQTRLQTESVIEEADMEPEDVANVLVVGGSTRIPKIQEILRKLFGKDPIDTINVDEAIACGAAIQAGIIMVDEGMIEPVGAIANQLKDARITDVSPHSFGTIVLSDFHGASQLRNDILIRRNTPLPAKRTETYYTVRPDQRSLACKVTQGEDEDPEFVKILSEEPLDLPPGLPDSSPIEVSFAYDLNGMLACSFVEPGSNNQRDIRLEVLPSRSQSAQTDDLDEADFDDLVIE